MVIWRHYEGRIYYEGIYWLTYCNKMSSILSSVLIEDVNYIEPSVPEGGSYYN